MKTLNTIQTVSKIGRILSKIVYICCIVGFIGCIVGIAAVLVGMQAVRIGGATLNSILENEAGVTMGTIWTAIAVGMIFSVGEFFLAHKAYRYFDNELSVGTPFTSDGAKELMHLGISVIWIPIVSAVSAHIAQEIITQLTENAEVIALDGFDNAALGVMFIIMSLICRYGAELKEKVDRVESE